MTESLDEHIIDIEQQMRQSNEIFLMEQYGLIGSTLDRTGGAEIAIEQWEDILLTRDELLLDLTDVMEALLTDYDRVIGIAGRYPDLRYLVDIFQAESDSAQLVYDQIRLRYRYRY